MENPTPFEEPMTGGAHQETKIKKKMLHELTGGKVGGEGWTLIVHTNGGLGKKERRGKATTGVGRTWSKDGQ